MGKIGKYILTAAVVCLMAMGLSDRALAANSGYCGNGVGYVYTDDKKLTISGSGEIDDYDGADSTPWSNYYDEVESIVIGEGITRIGDFAFSKMAQLESVSLPTSLTSMGEYAFSGCESLGSVTIPSGVTVIGRYVFEDCYALTGVTIQGKVTKIEYSAFSWCQQLSEITLPGTVKTIESYAFTGCNAFKNFNIPAGVTYLGDGVFSYCNNLENIEVAAGNTGFSSVNGVLFNKNKTRLIKYPEARTGDYTIPEGVTEIGNCAFQNTSGLSGVIIPDSVKSIEYKAFYDCTGLKQVKVPGKVKIIEYSTFDNCSALLSLELPEGVESVETEALDRCSALKSLTLPFSLKIVAFNAFDDVSDSADVYYGGDEADLKAIKVVDEYGNVVQSGIFRRSHPRMNYTTRVKGVSLEPKEVNILPGQTVELKCTIVPSDATIRDVTWKSDDTGIATVDANGVVRGISPGTATITVTTVNSKMTDTCTVKVLPQSMTLNATKLIIQAGKKSETVKAVLLNDTIAEVVSGDENVAVASFSGDTITVKAGKKAGKTVITVTSGSGIVQTFKVTVQADKVTTEKITMDKTKVALKKKEATAKVKVKASPDVVSTGEPIKVKLSSSSKKIVSATFDEATGIVTIAPKKTGTAYVKVCAGGKSKSVKVTVKLPVNVKKVKLNKTKLSFTKAGETKTLKATITPSNASNKKVTWRSSDTKVVKVTKNGKVTAMDNGSATVTVTTEDGQKKATCKVTVKLAKNKKKKK